jgi:RNase adapter protein RapZ
VSRLVFVGGSDLDAAVEAFVEAGFTVERPLPFAPDGAKDLPAKRGGVGDRMVPLAGDATMALKAADAAGSKYDLVHVGPDDGAPEGSHARAHHRVAVAELPALARRLRTREKLLVRCIAFGYKHGLPAGADWVVDARFLDNPYWVEELRPQTGLDPAVRRYVLAQPAAGELLDNLERTMAGLIPAYRSQGRQELTIAFGCTGGRHRSVVLATELARRLGSGEVDVETEYREL